MFYEGKNNNNKTDYHTAGPEFGMQYDHVLIF